MTTTTNRRHLVAGAAALALSAIPTGAAHAAQSDHPQEDAMPDTLAPVPPTAMPLPAASADDFGLFLTIDYRQTAGDGPTRATEGRYEVRGSRRGDAWSLHARRVLAAADAHDDALKSLDEVRLDDQTGGGDLLALLEALLHQPLAHDGAHLVDDLSDEELGVLRVASPALRDELVGLISHARNTYERWLGRWLLMADRDDLDRHAVSEPYQALVRRVRDEDLWAEEGSVPKPVLAVWDAAYTAD